MTIDKDALIRVKAAEIEALKEAARSESEHYNRLWVELERLSARRLSQPNNCPACGQKVQE